MTRPVAALFILAAWFGAALGGGCVSDAPERRPTVRSTGGRGTIEEINVLAIPVAVNLDQRPGLDGFVIKIFAGNRQRPKPLPIESGEIEVMMYDGVPMAAPGVTPQPLRIWKYSASELKPFETQGSIGICYQVAPLWGDAKPSGQRISVVVRYTPPGRPSILSAASIISTALK